MKTNADQEFEVVDRNMGFFDPTRGVGLQRCRTLSQAAAALQLAFCRKGAGWFVLRLPETVELRRVGHGRMLLLRTKRG